MVACWRVFLGIIGYTIRTETLSKMCIEEVFEIPRKVCSEASDDLMFKINLWFVKTSTRFQPPTLFHINLWGGGKL